MDFQTQRDVSPESPSSIGETAPTVAHRSRWRRRLVYVPILYVAWCLILFFNQDRMMFHPELAPRAHPSPPAGSELLSGTQDGQPFAGLFWPAADAAASSPRPVIVFCHGNAEIVDYEDRIVREYQRLGCSVMAIEYPGYGRLPGRASEASITPASVAAFDMMLKRPDVNRSRIAIHGRSLGGGVAAQLAARRPPVALILESTFTSVARFAWGYGVPQFLSTSPFRTDCVIGDFHFPLLIFHGTVDTVIPVSHGRRLHELAPGSRYVEYASDHNEFPGTANEQAYWQEVEQFLRRAGVLK